MSGLGIIQNIFINRKHFLFTFVMFLTISLIMIGPSYAIIDEHKNLDQNSGDSLCIACHANHKTLQDKPQQIDTVNNIRPSQIPIIQSSPNEVIGNISLITSIGQNWYQQGIYGPNTSGNVSIDKSWGWTFFDETPSSGFIIPPENTTQRNKIFALLLDSGNNSNPIKGALVTANVKYWTYDGVNYENNTVTIQLNEDIEKSGFYNGTFEFYGGSTYKNAGNMCSACHLSIFGGIDTLVGYFPGNYSINVTAQVNEKISAQEIFFQVTPWGCEDCHGSGDPHKKSVDLDSACYLCHGINQILSHYDAGNPHQNTAHRNIACTDCHTNKSINEQTFEGITFTKGGINNAILPQYNYQITQLNGGTHNGLACEDCHNDLILQSAQGSYKEDNYTIHGTVNNYTPNFASIQQFQDYYVLNVTTPDALKISLDWEGTSNIGFYLYPPNFNPKNRSNPTNYSGSTFTNKPEIANIGTPTAGKWVLAVYGYDFLSSWIGVLEQPINYTINSTFPIQKKDLPRIPECNTCHNSNGVAFTTDRIPDWNPGFAHVDTNNDGTLDIQCRMCHDAMHNIIIKDCHNCHTVAPIDHPIKEPKFGEYTAGQCLECHGDPHNVTASGGTDCIACHSPGDVNISLFGRHANINTSDGIGNVSNNDCWTCHYEKDMDSNHVYLCDSCHVNSSGIVNVTDPGLIKSEFWHGMTTCKGCHAPTGYHSNGTVGPLGVVENVLRKILIP